MDIYLHLVLNCGWTLEKVDELRRKEQQAADEAALDAMDEAFDELEVMAMINCGFTPEEDIDF